MYETYKRFGLCYLMTLDLSEDTWCGTTDAKETGLMQGLYMFVIVNPWVGIISNTSSLIQDHKNTKVLLVKAQGYPSLVYNVPCHDYNDLQCIHFSKQVHINQLVVYNVPCFRMIHNVLK